MYENLVAFLLGKKSELSNEEMREFMELLCNAMNLTEEFQTIEKESIIENIIDSVDVKDKLEREVISDAIENILMFEESSSDFESQENLFEDKSEKSEPLKARKVKRGRFNKSKESLISETKPIEEAKSVSTNLPENEQKLEKADEEISPNQIFKLDNINSVNLSNVKDLPDFHFEIGELEENNFTGPSFDFNSDEN